MRVRKRCRQHGGSLRAAASLRKKQKRRTSKTQSQRVCISTQSTSSAKWQVRATLPRTSESEHCNVAP